MQVGDYINILASAKIAVTQLEAENRQATRATWLFYGATGVLVANGFVVIFLVRVGEVALEKAKEQESASEGADA